MTPRVPAPPTDVQDPNARRRYHAVATLDYYRRRFDQREPVSTVIIDLVADLMLFAETSTETPDWERVVRIAEIHHAAESRVTKTYEFSVTKTKRVYPPEPFPEDRL